MLDYLAFVVSSRKRHWLAHRHPNDKDNWYHRVYPGVLSGMMRQCWGEPDGLIHAPSHLQKITGDKSTYKEVALKCNDVCAYGRKKGSLVLGSFNCHLSEKLT